MKVFQGLRVNINITKFWWCGYRFEIKPSLEYRPLKLHWICEELGAGLFYADGKFFAYVPGYSTDAFSDGTEALAYAMRKSHENRMRDKLIRSRLDALALLLNPYVKTVQKHPQFSFREPEGIFFDVSGEE